MQARGREAVAGCRASGGRDAVADRVAAVIDDGDFPAGAGRPGCGGGEVTGQGRVEGAEQPVVPGPGRSSLQGDQRDRHLGQRRVASSWTRGATAASWTIAAWTIAARAIAARAIAGTWVLPVAIRPLIVIADPAVARGVGALVGLAS